jgi:hypothetical protein
MPREIANQLRTGVSGRPNDGDSDGGGRVGHAISA